MCPTIVAIVLLTCVFFASALKMLMLEVPSPVSQGETVGMKCNYDLDGDPLYSIKWYKDDFEFYRFIPDDWPPGQFLPIAGVTVDLDQSGNSSISLRNVNLDTAGIYRCEVSAEGPFFQTVEAEKELTVFVLPSEGPRISGGKSKYDVGDMVAINCTSVKSKPAATLRWYINDYPSNGGTEYATEFSTTLHEDGLESSSLSLRFMVYPRHFKDGNMRLKCTASLSMLYTESNEELFVGGNQQSSQLQVNENQHKVESSGKRQFLPCYCLMIMMIIVLHL